MTLFLPTLWSIFADLGGWFLDVLRSWLFFHAWNVPKGHRSDVKIQPTRSCQKVWGNMSFITTGWECQICVYCHLGWQLQWNIHVAYRLIYIYVYCISYPYISGQPGTSADIYGSENQASPKSHHQCSYSLIFLMTHDPLRKSYIMYIYIYIQYMFQFYIYIYILLNIFRILFSCLGVAFFP